MPPLIEGQESYVWYDTIMISTEYDSHRLNLFNTDPVSISFSTKKSLANNITGDAWIVVHDTSNNILDLLRDCWWMSL